MPWAGEDESWSRGHIPIFKVRASCVWGGLINLTLPSEAFSTLPIKGLLAASQEGSPQKLCKMTLELDRAGEEEKLGCGPLFLSDPGHLTNYGATRDLLPFLLVRCWAKGKSLLPEPRNNPFVPESSITALCGRPKRRKSPQVWRGLMKVEERGGKSAELAVLPLDEKTKIWWHPAPEYTVWSQMIGGS